MYVCMYVWKLWEHSGSWLAGGYHKSAFGQFVTIPFTCCKGKEMFDRTLLLLKAYCFKQTYTNYAQRIEVKMFIIKILFELQIIACDC